MDAKRFEIRDDVQLVDVRDPDEWAAGHLQTALSIPLSQLNDRIGELSTAHPVITVCKTGVRSKKAAELLRSRGFHAESLEGGMQGLAGNFALITDGVGQPDSMPGENEAGKQDLTPELARLRDTMFEVLLAMQDRFGDRERTEQEELEFVREFLAGKGSPPQAGT